uniref:TNase-like domain-containing protein n=1 Tax=viral metagenome TaxID=1070528 RepID=A0A6C0CKY6_9ZZZZ
MGIITRVRKKLKDFDNTTPFFSLDGKVKRCKVVDVYDGDTVKVVFYTKGGWYRWNIRMYGYDAPEKRLPKNKYTDDQMIYLRSLERDATNYIKELILDKIIYIKCGEFDKYGRLLGLLYLKKKHVKKGYEKSVNKMMVNKGYGYEYFGGTKLDEPFLKQTLDHGL